MIEQIREYILEQIQNLPQDEQKQILQELADDFSIMCEDM